MGQARRYDSLSEEDKGRFRALVPPVGCDRPRLLEVGAASGNFVDALAPRERSARLVGLDIEEATLRTFPGARVLADGAAPPFTSGSFDVVVFSSSLHHVLRVDRTLAEAVRLLRPGGRLVLFEPNARHPVRFPIGSPIHRWPRLLSLLQGHLDPAFDPEEIADRLDKMGLSTERLHDFMPMWPTPGWRGRVVSVAFGAMRLVAPRRAYPWFIYVGRKR